VLLTAGVVRGPGPDQRAHAPSLILSPPPNPQFPPTHPLHSLGHFALVHHLQDTLLSTARASGQPGRVVSLSSSAHFGPYSPSPIRPEAEIDSKQGYSPWPAYGQSKLCNVLLARCGRRARVGSGQRGAEREQRGGADPGRCSRAPHDAAMRPAASWRAAARRHASPKLNPLPRRPAASELHKRWSAQGLPLVAVACHPGVIPASELFRHITLPWLIQAPLQMALTPFFKVRRRLDGGCLGRGRAGERGRSRPRGGPA
jgi:hypothetical protein